MKYLAIFNCTYCNRHYSSFECFKRHKNRHQRSYHGHRKVLSTKTHILCHSACSRRCGIQKKRDNYRIIKLASKSCYLCRIHFTNEEKLKSHMQSEHGFCVHCKRCVALKNERLCATCQKCRTKEGFRIYLCDCCHTYFTKINLEIHQQSEHALCEHCKKNFTSEGIKFHHQSKHACTHCNKHFTDEDLKIHMQSEHAEQAIPKYCKKKFMMDKHLCDCCQRYFTKEALEIHRQSKSILCKLCKKYFTMEVMTLHLKSEHLCARCQKHFTKENLKIHQSEHVLCEGSKEYLTKGKTTVHLKYKHVTGCPCCKNLVTKEDFKTHIEAKHATVCPCCKILVKKEDLKNHMKLEHVFCEYCKTFFLKEDIRHHLKSKHVTECPFCMRFIKKGEFEIHLLQLHGQHGKGSIKDRKLCFYCKQYIINTELLFHCKSEHLCECCLTYHEDLKTHMRTEHADLQCEFCQKYFNEERLAHHLKSDHECTYCKMHFSKDHLRIHLRSKHALLEFSKNQSAKKGIQIHVKVAK